MMGVMGVMGYDLQRDEKLVLVGVLAHPVVQVAVETEQGERSCKCFESRARGYVKGKRRYAGIEMCRRRSAIVIFCDTG